MRNDLKRWGSVHLTRYHGFDNDRGDHVLSRARDFAPMTREKAAKRLRGRDGLDRRTAMGAAAGRFTKEKIPIPVPMWACDPVPCSKDDSGIMWSSVREAEREAKPASWVDPMPDDLRWIEQAISALFRQHMLRALVIREEFCGFGPQRLKAERVAEQYGGHFSVDMYRKELARGLDFIDAWQRLDNAA